jgi:hypothetical protein
MRENLSIVAATVTSSNVISTVVRLVLGAGSFLTLCRFVFDSERVVTISN